MSDEYWKSLNYYSDYTFTVKASDGKSITQEQYTLKKINTEPSINLLKPTDGQYVYQGYIKFEWDVFEPDNQGYGSPYLKVYTDTPNTFNNGLIYEGSVKHGKGTQEVFYYLPEGTHNICFEITDGKSEPVIENILVKVDKMVNINIDNGAKTFYIADFDQEKSNIYYNDINNRLVDNIYMLNILGKNGDLNEEYIKKIQGMVNVTRADNYLNKGDKIYNKDGIDSVKIIDWILEKLESDTKNNVMKVTDTLNMEKITFEDEEKDYTSTEPNRGKNRRYQVFHIPTYYDNPDEEIVDNGQWINDDVFYSFDGKEGNLLRTEEGLKLQINKAGKYILNVVEDDDIQNNHGKDFSKSSPNIDYIFYAHRPPKAVLRYEENEENGDNTIKLISSDSYDPDFMNRKPNKGIKEVVWEYRELSYTNDVITDWTKVSDIDRFSIDSDCKTLLRLTVKDYGGLVDVDDILVLSDSDTVLFDPTTGFPPKADFSINVGKDKEETSIDSQGFVYKGSGGKINGQENIYLINKTIWNDFFAKSGTRSIDYSKNNIALNSEVKNGIKNLSTTLSVTNKFNLKDSITKKAIVKTITLNTPTIKTTNYNNYPNLPIELKNKLITGSQSQIKVVLNADSTVKWGDMKVTIQSQDMGIGSEKGIKHEVTNVFSMQHKLPDNKENLKYTIRVYSRRTNVMLIEKDFEVKTNSYLTVDGKVNPNKDLFAGDLINITDISTISANDVKNVKIDLYRGDTFLQNIGIVGERKKKDRDKIYWQDYKNFKLPNNLTKGDYVIKLTATDINGKTAIKNLVINVIEVEVKNFRITTVYDIHWKNRFVDKNGVLIPGSAIYTNSMPAEFYGANPIKMGYKLDFEVDSFGLNDIGDDLYVDVEFLDSNGNKISPNYIKYKENDSIKTLPSSYYSIGKTESKFRTRRIRTGMDNSTWQFSYYIPATTFVNGKNKISVKFTIIGKKKNGPTVNYNAANNFNGKTFVYTLKKNALDDYYIRSGN